MNEPIQQNKWLNLIASEEMDSNGANPLIARAIGEMNKITGIINDRVLCVGCGDGTELTYFYDVIGIDLNEESLEKCREKELHVIKMDMHRMSFDDNVFELVFARDVFEHALSSIEAISEMARVSKKYVCIILPDESWQSSSWHFIIPTLKQMLSLGEKVGLKLKSYREYNLYLGQTTVWQHLYLFEK